MAAPERGEAIEQLEIRVTAIDGGKPYLGQLKCHLVDDGFEGAVGPYPAIGRISDALSLELNRCLVEYVVADVLFIRKQAANCLAHPRISNSILNSPRIQLLGDFNQRCLFAREPIENPANGLHLFRRPWD